MSNAFEQLVASHAANGGSLFGDSITLDSEGMTLRAVLVNYGKVEADDVLAGRAAPVEFTLTSDGRGYVGTWHEGETDIERWAYVERWSARGREFHGWCDGSSRRLVQAG